MKYRIWEQLMTEYTKHPGETSRSSLVGEVEAESHAEAYKKFLQLNPMKKGLPLTVKDDQFSVEFSGEEFGGK